MDEARRIVEGARSEGRSKLLEHEALRLCELYGLPVPSYGLATSEEGAVKLAQDIGFPVVLKVVSPDISHKSDVGGVVLELRTPEDVGKAYRSIVTNVSAKAPGSRIVGVLVQGMVERDLEVIVGGIRDKVFGPVVMFGLGGIFVEVLRDVSLRITPITEYDAEEMLEEIKSASILRGYRGMPPRDRRAIVDIILKVGKLMDEVPEVTDIDLNPIMVFPEGRGAKIADARILVRRV